MRKIKNTFFQELLTLTKVNCMDIEAPWHVYIYPVLVIVSLNWNTGNKPKYFRLF